MNKADAPTGVGTRFADQVALISGGGGGIGRAVALSLAEAGCRIVVVERIAERAEEIAARCAELGVASAVVIGNAADALVMQQAADAASAQFGRLDILVNNVGGVRRTPFLEQSAQNWQKLIDLNLGSTLVGTAAAVPLMIRGGRGGAIVNVSSIEASRAAPGYAVYAACKAAVENFTRSAALEFAEHGIRVNAIAPDYTVTPGLRGNVSGPVAPENWWQPDEKHLNAVTRRIPLGRAGIDSECGNVVRFLCSAESSYVTGTVMPVDGGSWASSGWIRNSEGQWTLDGND